MAKDPEPGNLGEWKTSILRNSLRRLHLLPSAFATTSPRLFLDEGGSDFFSMDNQGRI